VIFSICSLLFPAGAASADLKPKERGSDTVLIEADRLDVSIERGSAIFKGNVRAVKGDMDLRAQTATLHYDRASRRVTTLVADGAVSILWGGRHASCDKATWRIQDQVMELLGNVTIVQGAESISGQRVSVDLRRNTQTVEGGQGRVKVRVETDGQTGIMQWRK